MKRSLVVALVASLGIASVAGAHPRGRWHGHHDRPAQPLDLGRIQAIGQACQNAMVGTADEQACVSIVAAGRGAFDPITTIAACEQAMVGDADTLACLSSAVRSPQDPVAAIHACEQAMVGDADALACIATTSRSWLPVSAVGACEQAMVGDADALACLDALIGTRYDVAQLVSYCENSTVGDDAALQCIRSWR